MVVVIEKKHLNSNRCLVMRINFWRFLKTCNRCNLLVKTCGKMEFQKRVAKRKIVIDSLFGSCGRGASGTLNERVNFAAE